MDRAEGSRVNGDSFRGVNGRSTDLIYEFIRRSPDNGGREDMELNLGLSTNGRFGVDPTREKLRRSSSLSNVVAIDDSADNGTNPQAPAVALGSHAPLTRASSLPSEFGAQELRRQEVIRSPGLVLNLKNPMVVKENGNCSRDFEGNGLHVHPNGNPQRQEATHNPRARGSSVEANEEYIRNPTADMPYVSTRGFGPENRPITGFLYRYGKGKDVKILCVCHGLFLSPAEFVRHGGGGDVKYPLKHIVVTSFPLDD